LNHTSYQIRVKYPFFGGNKADGRWQHFDTLSDQAEGKKTSAEKGVIKAELASFMVLNRERLFIKKK
jgi:hypothetical protein